MRWRDYFNELIGNDSERDVSVGTVGTEVKRERETGIWERRTLQRRK